MSDVAIIDYNLSNLHSVKRALDFAKIKSIITSDRKEILNSKLAILPGVGAFGEAMLMLNQLKLIEVINEFISTGKPFIGICLGMQLLFDESEEFGNFKGLGMISGKVKKFNNHSNYKIPHIGWNLIKPSSNNFGGKIVELNDAKKFMYFVHSYYVIPNSEKIALTYTNYAGINFCSSLIYKNIIAFQFHPEKSGFDGLNIYKNICNLINE